MFQWLSRRSYVAFCPGNKKHYLSLGCFCFWYLQMGCKDVLRWWGRSGKLKFPYLAPAAQQVLVFGNQAAAAQVQRDFSGAVISSHLTGVRHIPGGDDDVPEGKLRAHSRARGYPHGRCEGYPRISSRVVHRKYTVLVAAEVAIDVLTNAAASTAGEMSFDED